MLLENLEARAFRNLAGKIDWGNGLNVLIGDNGQGKTNWLEAIYLLSTTRSFRTAKLQETIRFGEELAIVRGRVRQSEGIARDLQVTIEKTIKSFSINGKRETHSRYSEEMHAFVFNAEALDVVRGQPEARRRFLDESIIAVHPPFVQTFRDLARTLKQKNALLQSIAERGDPLEKAAELLEPWNEQLISLAARVHRGRVRIVERLNEALEKRLFGNEEVQLRYASSLEGKGDLSDYEALLTERLRLRVQAEVAAGRSLIGPHRDELEITFDGHDIRKFGSSGQQRSAMLVLLLANLEVYNATRGEYPLFLIDDIDAELDFKRIGSLLEFLAGRTQTFVTTSKTAFVSEFGASAAVFRAADGTAESAANAAV
ncbi:MAG: DNA replication and repair protein RecF [Acidobacteria bacterium]|nr:DNA replication and repair protein RecF [Acidobacteriota bacterium]